MNNMRNIARIMVPVLAVMLVAGCTASQATISPTMSPLTCPTAPACAPTA